MVGFNVADPKRPPSSGNAAVCGAVEFDPRRPHDDPITAVLGGPLTVFGQNAKSAAVPHPDGSHRRLYCLEAPESLFEDFGRAHLRAGVLPSVFRFAF